jgi:hypothetical protein
MYAYAKPPVADSSRCTPLPSPTLRLYSHPPPCQSSITALPIVPLYRSLPPPPTGMISLSISASSLHLDHMSAPPSLRYQASIYSTHSHSHPYRYGYRSNRNTSLEQLVPKKRVRFDGKAPPADRTHKSKARMSASEDGGITIERKKSYGIGGAGNIRRFHS